MENQIVYQAIKDTVGVINHALNGLKPTDVKNYSVAYKIAKNNGVQSLFSLGLKGLDGVDNEIKALADKTFNVEALQLSKQEYYAEEIFKALKENDIKFMPLKGYVLRDLYPKKEMRNSCDIDFYFDIEKRSELAKILQKLGFTLTHKGPAHDVWEIDTVTIEPHFTLFSNADEKFKGLVKTSFDDLVLKGNSEYAFSVEDYYLYMIYHAYKHIKHSALSIKTIVDFYVFNKKVKYDKGYVDTKLEEFGLKTFNEKIKKLYGVWFDNLKEDDETIALSTYIAKNILFGDASNLFIMCYDLKSQDKNNTKKVFLSRIFPTFTELKLRYKWLKSPLLYPIGWLARVFTVVFVRPKFIFKNVKNIKKIDKDKVQEIENIRKILDI